MGVVKSKLLKQISNSFPNFQKKDVAKITDIILSEIKRVSKPGCRVYSGINELPKVYNGLGISILSTPRGVMSDNEARAANVGGEVLCQVF